MEDWKANKKRHAKLALAFVATALLLVGCGDKEGADAPGIPNFYEASVPESQRSYINGTLLLLQTGSFTRNMDYYAGNLGLSTLTPNSMFEWFRERATTMVGQSFDWQNTKFYSSALSSLSGGFLEIEPELEASDRSYTTAVNVCGSLYRQGKPYNKVYAIPSSKGTLVCSSPRRNVLQTGEGFDMEGVSIASGVPKDAEGNEWIAASILIHEGVHTNARGVNVANPHAICDASKGVFKGEAACEQFSNGPYVVQWTVLNAGLQNCRSCSSAEQQMMQFTLKSIRERIPNSGLQYNDPTPEGFL